MKRGKGKGKRRKKLSEEKKIERKGDNAEEPRIKMDRDDKE
jgi:hypothetical protein